MPPIGLDPTADSVWLFVRRHGERSKVGVSQPIGRLARIEEDQFLGSFTTIVSSGRQVPSQLL